MGLFDGIFVLLCDEFQKYSYCNDKIIKAIRGKKLSSSMLDQMRIFLAGESPWSDWHAGPLGRIITRRLYSYYYHGFKIGNRLSKEVKLAHECGMDLFLDSGAYSAFTAQKKGRSHRKEVTQLNSVLTILLA
jgi:hypothetical protein